MPVPDRAPRGSCTRRCVVMSGGAVVASPGSRTNVPTLRGGTWLAVRWVGRATWRCTRGRAPVPVYGAGPTRAPPSCASSRAPGMGCAARAAPHRRPRPARPHRVRRVPRAASSQGRRGRDRRAAGRRLASDVASECSSRSRRPGSIGRPPPCPRLGVGASGAAVPADDGRQFRLRRPVGLRAEPSPTTASAHAVGLSRSLASPGSETARAGRSRAPMHNGPSPLDGPDSSRHQGVTHARAAMRSAMRAATP